MRNNGPLKVYNKFFMTLREVQEKNLFYSILEYCPVGHIYVVMCLLVRTVEAMACAGSSTASFTMSAHVFSGRVSTVVVSISTKKETEGSVQIKPKTRS